MRRRSELRVPGAPLWLPSLIAQRDARHPLAPAESEFSAVDLLCSGRVCGADTPRDFLAACSLHHRKSILGLQAKPELSAVAEIAREAQRRVGADRATLVQNVGHAARRNAEIKRKPVGA